MPFISYARNYEDVLLWRALGSVGVGFYIDVGAFHPDENSVTRAFHDRGWTGVNIEPVGASFARLAAARLRDVNLRCVVGAASSVTLLDSAQTAGLSTTDSSQSLAGICQAYAPADIHFLKVDAKGAEREVLEGADFTRYRPWIVVLEAVAPVTRAPTHDRWEDLMLAADYRFAWFDGLNRFYVAAEHDVTLRSHFGTPPNVFDDFIRPADTELARQLAESQRAHDAAQAEAAFAALRAQSSDARVRDALQARVDLRELLGRARQDLENMRANAEWHRGLQQKAETLVGQLREQTAWLQEVQETFRQQAAAALQSAQGMHDAALARMKAADDAALARTKAADDAALARAEEADAALARAEKADAALAAVHASRSWRITAPLRRLIDWRRTA